jgi:hypothetical protein
MNLYYIQIIEVIVILSTKKIHIIFPKSYKLCRKNHKKNNCVRKKSQINSINLTISIIDFFCDSDQIPFEKKKQHSAAQIIAGNSLNSIPSISLSKQFIVTISYSSLQKFIAYFAHTSIAFTGKIHNFFLQILKQKRNVKG